VTPLISVLIPCYRQARFLDECLASVHAQSLSSWEAVVVAQDDESTRVAAAWHHEKIIVLKMDAAGVAAARNTAAHAASGAYLLPLDADDTLSWDALNTLALQISSSEHAIAYSDMAIFGDALGEWCPKYSALDLLHRNCLPNSSLHTRALWEDAGGWEEVLPWYEDWAYWISCSRFKPSVTHVEEKLVHHRKWGGNASGEFSPWHNVYSAMVRTLYPTVYPPSREDRIIIANEGRGLLQSLQEKLKRYPKHVVLQEWVALIEGNAPAE
jgi:hypothetical protein